MALTQPATNGEFSFAGDSLFAHASGNNLHRRATVPELQAHFNAAEDSQDRPAHWYEAQLKHYGLPSSRVKGTAKMRLYDAVKRGCLTVPAQLKALETDLKKQWKKQDQDTKKAAVQTPTTATTSKKRKADASANVSASKAAKTSTKTAARGKVKEPTSATPGPLPKQTAKRGGSEAGSRIGKEIEAKPSVHGVLDHATRTKQAARRGGCAVRGRAGSGTQRGNHAGYAARDASSPAACKKQTTTREKASNPSTAKMVRDEGPPPSGYGIPNIQTARRGGSYLGGSSGAGGSSQTDGHGGYSYGNDDDDTPPSPLYPGNTGRDSDDSFGGRNTSNRPLYPPLGLLNGHYEVRNPRGVNLNQPSPFSLILTLDGNKLWGWIDMGDITGIICLSHRPYEASDDKRGVLWRGHYHDDDGIRRYRDGSRSQPCQYITFLGGGRIRGSLRYAYAREAYREFEATRVSGQGTRSEISPTEMRRRWEDFEYKDY